MTGLPSPGDGGAQGPVQVWVRAPAWGGFCPSGTALPWRRQPPNRPEQSPALTPLPTARPAFACQDPALSAARPPWASSPPATSSLGAHGSHPGLRGVGGGVPASPGLAGATVAGSSAQTHPERPVPRPTPPPRRQGICPDPKGPAWRTSPSRPDVHPGSGVGGSFQGRAQGPDGRHRRI